MTRGPMTTMRYVHCLECGHPEAYHRGGTRCMGRAQDGQSQCDCRAFRLNAAPRPRPVSEGNPDLRPEPDSAQLSKFLSALSDGAWVTGREVKGQTGLNDRTLRELASQSGGQILGGQKGYRLTAKATDDECWEIARWLESQARKMTKRASEIRGRVSARRQGSLTRTG